MFDHTRAATTTRRCIGALAAVAILAAAACSSDDGGNDGLVVAAAFFPIEEAAAAVGGDLVDPHVWLDPARMIAIADAMVDRLSEIDPDNADTYRSNADSYLADLTGLDGECQAALDDCASR